HGISNSLLHSWKKKFPPKSFALVEIKTPEPKDISSTIQPTPIEMAVPQGIRVIVQKRIVVEFPLTAEPSAIALFVKALEG
ncbi:MAG TPA: hypothetical protein VE954_31690, partial [Oligoflexus sp.]|uniref:hypothetical protein n=1 Tax=Oligoflexus sp. TaxID=1971216 RepID=UPI002D51D558